jgi:transcription antitermination factor NusG
MPWHVALVWAGHERDGFENLIEAGFSVFWPRWMETIKVLGRSREQARSLAPGYLFVNFDGTDASVWHEVREHCGATFGGYIGGEWPTAVPEAAFAPIFEAGADATGLMPLQRDLRVEPAFRPGDRVRMLGAMDGAAEGTVTWADRRGVRVTTMMFGRQMECYVPNTAGMLEKVVKENKTLTPHFGRHKKRYLRAAQA